MRPRPHYEEGDKIGGRYLVHRALAGGMGEVYLCKDTQQNVPVALKTFRQELKSPAVQRAFEDEVGTWVALEKHPNIVRCFYMDTIANQPFMFLEWIAGDESRGTSLEEWLARGPLDLRLALDFTIDLCRGLIHANTKQPGIVHRDLKPLNVLVNPSRIAKITDFGLAKVIQKLDLGANTPAGKQVPHRSNMVGTPVYMAPEQWRGGELDQRTDLFATGCILYKMLTGRLAYPETSIAPRARMPELAGTLSFLNPVLEGCLTEERDGRYPDVVTLLKELTRIYRGRFNQEPRALGAIEQFSAVDYANRGITYSDLGQYPQALADLNQALRLDPNDAVAYNNRGNIYHKIGQYTEALPDYSQALRLDPNGAQVYHNRGYTYYKLGQYEQAMSDFNQALRFDPNLAVAYNNRGLTYHKLGEYEKARKDYDQAIQLDPNDSKVRYNRGAVYSGLGQYEQALADFNQALRLDPNFAAAYYYLGAMHVNQNKLKEALPYFEKAALLGDAQAAQVVTQIRQKLGMGFPNR